MTEINLLPWRLAIQQKKIKRNRILVFVFLLGLLCVALNHYRPIKNTHPMVIKSFPVLAKKNVHSSLQWAGYLREKRKFIGLIKLPTGVIQEVEVGSVIENNKLVVDIDEVGIILLADGKREKVHGVF